MQTPAFDVALRLNEICERVRQDGTLPEDDWRFLFALVAPAPFSTDVTETYRIYDESCRRLSASVLLHRFVDEAHRGDECRAILERCGYGTIAPTKLATTWARLWSAALNNQIVALHATLEEAVHQIVKWHLLNVISRGAPLPNGAEEYDVKLAGKSVKLRAVVARGQYSIAELEPAIDEAFAWWRFSTAKKLQEFLAKFGASGDLQTETLNSVQVLCEMRQLIAHRGDAPVGSADRLFDCVELLPDGRHFVLDCLSAITLAVLDPTEHASFLEYAALSHELVRRQSGLRAVQERDRQSSA